MLKKIGKKVFSKIVTQYKTVEEMIKKLQTLECDLNLKFHQDFSKDYDEINHVR